MKLFITICLAVMLSACGAVDGSLLHSQDTLKSV